MTSRRPGSAPRDRAGLAGNSQLKNYDKGGIKALDFESMFGTLKVKWLKTYLSQPDSMWFHIPRSLFKKIGGLEFILQCDLEVTRIP